MKKELYLFIAVAALSVGYGIYSSANMLFSNRSPYTITCDGILLDTAKVYAISNHDKTSADTIYLHYTNSEVIAPSTLGFVYYDRQRGEFVLKNHPCVFNPANGAPGNYFLPFCRTLKDGIYFGANETIPQTILLERGIKYNTAVGTKENRISIKFSKTAQGMVLSTKDEGIQSKYLVQRGKKNLFEVYLNSPIGNSICPNIFQFEHTTSDTGSYTIAVTPDLFSTTYAVTDEQNSTIVEGSGNTPSFYINEFQFSLNPKYSQFFSVIFVACFIIIIFFQIYFLKAFSKAKSPLIKSLFSFRILLNCIAFMAIPLFLTSSYLVVGRNWYLLLLVVLNASFFLPKDFLSKLNFSFSSRLLSYVVWLTIAAAPFVFKFATVNESLLGIIPILHCQKALILLLFFATQNSFFNSSQRRYFFRIAFILFYSLGISFITADTGSFIYAGLAIVLVELIRKTIGLKHVFASLTAIALVTFLMFKIAPETFSKDRKTYRIVAPYVSPESDKLEMANQADRESYSSLILNLKNIEGSDAPEFNDLIIPGNMRSTMHSDFAFHWSLTFGGWVFFFLFLTIVFLLLSKLLLLLYCSIRVCRVQQDTGFIFPTSRSAELVRFLLAFTIIGFTYPIASNLLLIPLTGQSIPVLSISNVEVIFLIVLIVSLENIFNKPNHFVTAKTKYGYGDLRKSIYWGLSIIFVLFGSALILKFMSFYFAPETLNWKKHISDERIQLEGQIPDRNDKQALVDFAKTVIGSDDLTAVHKSKKPLLKNLASLYYSYKPYTETIHESATFYNSTEKMRSQMSVDSFFSEKRKLISGTFEPYGKVYSMAQKVNNHLQNNVSHPLYNCIPLGSASINADLTAECNDELQRHLLEINIAENIGSIVIIDNRTGGIVANSTFPFDREVNSNEVYYFVGSLKKTLLAYCALTIDENYKLKQYGDKTFEEFIKNSDDFFAASLLKDLLTNHQDEFDKVLQDDFGIPLFSLTDDSYLDIMPTPHDFLKPLDRNNTIYRQAIGQQRPYKFIDATQWYARIASMTKLTLNYSDEPKRYGDLSISLSEYDYLKQTLNSVLTGTATNVGASLHQYGIKMSNFICKTGTSEKADRSGNASSSFIIANDRYTIGIMLKGTIPQNNERLAAKDLFNKLIPLLTKYEIL
ncbi:MAG: hypothetical protein SH857_13985 [Chitinophagales bacterium]|nr:hypothetical protein [Chitinophagales bacterium]